MSMVIIFGATGEIGQVITDRFQGKQWEIAKFSRTSREGYFSLDELQKANLGLTKADCVVWASGANLNDSMNDYKSQNVETLLQANLFYILEGLDLLIKSELLSDRCSLVIVSSIWQELSKSNKLSYSISKSALRGLVQSLVADMSPKGVRINAILPGVVDTSMSRTALSEDQIAKIEKETPTGNLTSLNSVANLAFFLGGPESSDINGQNIVIDGGWTAIRHV
jgi:NAD(P)-dependent dehydrogenase (short-subunit alcohol dehydrogenase family)